MVNMELPWNWELEFDRFVDQNRLEIELKSSQQTAKARESELETEMQSIKDHNENLWSKLSELKSQNETKTRKLQENVQTMADISIISNAKKYTSLYIDCLSMYWY